MAEEAPIELPLQQPVAARHYAMLSLLMLLVLTILLTERVAGVWSVLPLLFGAGFLMVQWREGPTVVLVLVAYLLLSVNEGGNPIYVFEIFLTLGLRYFAARSQHEPAFDDFLIAGAFLLYAAAYYRYLGLERHLFPLDVRKRPYAGLGSAERRRLIEEPQRRAPETVTLRELGTLGLAVPLWIGGAAALWQLAMPYQPQRYDFGLVLWSALKVLYLFGIPLLLFRAGIAYSNQCRAGRGESMMYLQEQLWRETRREQSRLNRWLTWARLRAQRRKENA